MLVTPQISQQCNLTCKIVRKIKSLFWQMSDRVRPIQSEISTSQRRTFGEYFSRFEVYTFTFMLIKKIKNRTTGIRDILV